MPLTQQLNPANINKHITIDKLAWNDELILGRRKRLQSRVLEDNEMTN